MSASPRGQWGAGQALWMASTRPGSWEHPARWARSEGRGLRGHPLDRASRLNMLVGGLFSIHASVQTWPKPSCPGPGSWHRHPPGSPEHGAPEAGYPGPGLSPRKLSQGRPATSGVGLLQSLSVALAPGPWPPHWPGLTRALGTGALALPEPAGLPLGAVGGAWGWCTAAPRFSAWPVGSSTFSGTARLRAGVGSVPVNRRLQLGCLQLGRLYWGVSGVLHTQGPSGGTAAGFTGLLFRTRGGSAHGERAVSLGGGQAGWPGRPRTAQHRAAACAPFLGRQAWFGGQRSPASVLWPPLLSTRPGELAWSLGQEGLRAVTAEPGGLILAQHSQAGPPG